MVWLKITPLVSLCRPLAGAVSVLVAVVVVVIIIVAGDAAVVFESVPPLVVCWASA